VFAVSESLPNTHTRTTTQEKSNKNNHEDTKTTRGKKNHFRIIVLQCERIGVANWLQMEQELQVKVL
jgi:hypothetical protein